MRPFEMGTAARPLHDASELTNPNMVKVVCDSARLCPLFFARADSVRPRRVSARRSRGSTSASMCIGATRCCASRGLPPGPLERLEALEQLRALEHGIRIQVVDTIYESLK